MLQGHRACYQARVFMPPLPSQLLLAALLLFVTCAGGELLFSKGASCSSLPQLNLCGSVHSRILGPCSPSFTTHNMHARFIQHPHGCASHLKSRLWPTSIPGSFVKIPGPRCPRGLSALSCCTTIAESGVLHGQPHFRRFVSTCILSEHFFHIISFTL